MLLSLIRNRRSIRKFEDRPVEREKVDILVEAMLRSPSSRGLNPWKFIVLEEEASLRALSESKPHGSSFLKHAPLAIVVCGDAEAADTWVEDTSIAATYIQLTAQSLGLGSCWVQIRERRHSDVSTARDFVAKRLDIPEGLCVESIIAVGYPDETKPPHDREKLQWDKVRYNRYGRPYGE